MKFRAIYLAILYQLMSLKHFYRTRYYHQWILNKKRNKASEKITALISPTHLRLT